MKYKATKAFKELDNKFFGIHKVKSLENGGVVEVDTPSDIPEEVLATLKEFKETKPKTKTETKKVEKTTEGDK
tara:strand:- start:306 stop:524 length:219 start_codon:yes stop_codon:yes gene_type:complete